MLRGVRLFATPQTVARQAPPSVEFSRKEYWSRLLFPPPGDLSDPGIEPASLTSPALAGTVPPGKPQVTTALPTGHLVPTSKRAVRTSKDSTELQAGRLGSSSGLHLNSLSDLGKSLPTSRPQIPNL